MENSMSFQQFIATSKQQQLFFYLYLKCKPSKGLSKTVNRTPDYSLKRINFFQDVTVNLNFLKIQSADN